jgi:hypothetical protein
MRLQLIPAAGPRTGVSGHLLSRRDSLANPLAERGGDLHEYSDGKPTRTARCAACEDAEAARQHERSWQQPGDQVIASVSGLLSNLAHVRQARSRCPRCCPGVAVVALGRPSHRARGGHDLLTRRSGQVVQDRPSPVVGCADIPEFAYVGRCPAAWQQCWQQSRRNGADPRPSAFQAGPMPSGHGSYECYALLPVAAACRWSLLLLSPLLSTRPGRSSSSRRPKPTAATTIPAITTATPRIPGHADQKGIFPAVYTLQLIVSRPLTPMIVRPFSIQRSDLWQTLPAVFVLAIFRSDPYLFLRPYHGNRPVTARTVQGMARARSGQAPAWPLVADRSVRSGLQDQA